MKKDGANQVERFVMPIQPLRNDEHGVLRFVPNRIVKKLLEVAPIDLNDIAMMDFTDEERMQFSQLTGYSLAGFGTLSFVDDETYEAATHINNGALEISARNIHLREKLDSLRKALKEGVELLYEIGIDDLE